MNDVELIKHNLEILGWRCLAEGVARHHSIALDKVLARSRVRRVQEAWHHLCAVLRWSTDASYPTIARVLGVNHSTVLFSERVHGAALERAYGIERGPWAELARRSGRRTEVRAAIL